MNKRTILLMLGTLGVLFAGTPPGAARADTVVTNCANDSQLTDAIAAGGKITFSCGKATIVLKSPKTIFTKLTIDGGGKITLSGNNAVRHFQVSKLGELTLKNITVRAGFANGNGGAMHNLGALVLENAIVSQNSIAGDWGGGAIYSKGSLTVKNSFFDSNRAAHRGGAIALAKSSLASIENSFFYSNQATGWNAVAWGGAINNAGTLVLLNSTFDSNTSYLWGGAVANGKRLVAVNTTWVRNRADVGAALYHQGGRSTVTNSTFSQNIANYASAGAGIHLIANELSLRNVTFSGNTLAIGGASLGNGGIVSMRNTILNAGRSGDNCSDMDDKIVSEGFNLSSDDSCNLTQPTDQVNVNPKLLGLANNGGLTQTHLLAPDSPARDAGTGNGANQQDQRGITRPQGDAVDIGAVELRGSEPCWNAPPEPLPGKPKEDALVKKQPILFDWQDTPCAAKYKLTIKEGATDGPTVLNKSGLAFSQYQHSGLEKGEIYYWRVKACNGGNCANSAWRMFQMQ